MAVNRYIPRAKAARYAAALPLRNFCAVNACGMTPQLTMFNPMSLDAIMPGLLRLVFFLSFYLFIITLVPGLPHSADNIQWVCMRVNLGKNRFSD